MRPEDIDKLFKERLGPSSPTPPADLWGRLQERIETEMPNTQQEEKKSRGFMYLSYSIAAAITLLLAVGLVFFNVQRGQVPADGMAKNTEQLPEQPLIITEPAATEPSTSQGIAQATEQGNATTSDKAIPETALPAAKSAPSVKAAVQGTMASNTIKPTAKQENTDTRNAAAAAQLVAQAKPIVLPDTPQKGDYYNTGETVPATFATNTVNMNAQPVEIIIKRAVYMEPQQEEVELNGFEKKQKLAKNIFKQVRNLSNGERVELSELGINADRIAFETQIGKQKISKVINL